MKVLQVNCFYRFGSTGKIVADLHEGLISRGFESIVCYGRRRQPDEPNVYKISTELEGKLCALLTRLFSQDFGYSWLATIRVIRLIRKEKPDVVHLHCLNGHFVNVYRLLNYLKQNRIRTVLTLHAELMHTAGCDYAVDCEKWRTMCHDCPRLKGRISRWFRDDAAHCYRRMRSALSGFDTLTAAGVSEWVADRAKSSPIMEGCRFDCVYNGVNTDIFRYRDAAALRKRLGIQDEKKIVLHVTPDFRNPIKGGTYVLDLARRMPGRCFVIVGFNADPADLPENVIPVPRTQDQEELAVFYSMADATLLTSKRETFSMVCAESLCCGTPVLGFCAGAPETISLPQYSCFVAYGDIEKLEAALNHHLDRCSVNKRFVSGLAGERYSAQQMTQGYIRLYEA